MFHVHSALLCNNSEYFTAALPRDWKDSEEKPFSLDDDSVRAFELWISYLYTGSVLAKIQQTWKADANISSKQKSANNRNTINLVDAYMLGDKLGDLDFMDLMIDQLIRFSIDADSYPSNLASKIARGTTEDSLLRRLLVDMIMFTGHENWLSIPDDIMVQVTKGFIRNKEKHIQAPCHSHAPYMKDDCTYHTHTSRGKPCYNTKQ